MTNEEHNKYIAYAFLGHAAFQLLMLLFMIAIFSLMLAGEPGQPGPPPAFIGVMIAFMTILQLIFTAPSVVAAYALLKRKSWARIASIVGGVIAAMSMPFGTAACVYALWFFLGDNWKSVYPEKAEQFAKDRPQIPYGVESQREAYRTDNRDWEKVHSYEPPDWR